MNYQLELLKKFIPETFLESRLNYFDILSKTDLVSDNWNSWARYCLEKEDLTCAKNIFIDYGSYSTQEYYLKYLDILNNKKILSNFLEYEESDVLGKKQKINRGKLDTIKEGYFLLQFIKDGQTILDIGSGYGRLAEFFIKTLSGCTYILQDVIPMSVIFAEYYITSFLNPSKICYLSSNEYSNKTAIFIHPDNIINISPDLVINIHSMDEMNLGTIDEYLTLINKLNPKFIFLKNHFKTYTLGYQEKKERIDWTFLIPKSWKLLYNSICEEEFPIQTHNPTYERVYKLHD